MLGVVVHHRFGSGEDNLGKIKKNINWNILKEMGHLATAHWSTCQQHHAGGANPTWREGVHQITFLGPFQPCVH